MLKRFQIIVNYVAGDDRHFSLEHRIFNTLSVFNGFLNIAGSFGLIYLDNFLVLITLSVSTGLLYLIFWYITRFKHRYLILYWPFIFLTLFYLGTNWMTNGGSIGGAHYYMIAAALFAIIIAKKVLTYSLTFLLFILTTSIFFYIEYFYPEMVTSYASRNERYLDVYANFTFIQVFAGTLVLILSHNLNLERRKSDRLLQSILPSTIAEELKLMDKSTPRKYDNATVLFTDFVGFTKISEDLSAEELVEELDLIFREFDRIIKNYNIEKIKTIGDSYMAVGGIPVQNKTHPLDCVMAALEIADFMDLLKEEKERAGKIPWQVRIGVNTGSLIAGVIGDYKFAYDVWGDTVNTASRLESTGEAGRVNISSHTHKLIHRYFQTDYRGRVSAKNKGEIEMFFVNGLKPEFSSPYNSRLPNKAFLKALHKKRHETEDSGPLLMEHAYEG